MALNPSFVEQKKTEASSGDSAIFSSNKNTLLYKVLCRDSSSSGEAYIELSNVETSNGLNINLNYSHKWANDYRTLPTVNIKSISGSANAYAHFIYSQIDDFTLTFPSDFPLTEDKVLDLSFDITNDTTTTSITTSIELPSSTTLEEAGSLIFNRLNIQYFSDIFPDSQQISVPFVRNRTSAVRNVTLDFVRPSLVTSNPSNLFDITTSGSNTITFSQKTESHFEKTVPKNQSYGRINGSAVLADPYGEYYGYAGVEGSLVASDSTYEANSGETGSTSDPFPLFYSISDWAELAKDGETIPGSNLNIKISSMRISSQNDRNKIISENFSGSGETLELISSTNSPSLIDSHGNKYIPIESGRKVFVEAPVDSIVFVYGEE